MTKRKKKSRNRKKPNYGSILTGVGLGVLIGWYISGFFAFQSSLMILLGISMVLFGYFAYKKPVFLEYLAYAMSVFFILQFAWDYRVGDISEIRTNFFIMSLVLLFINMATGKVKLIGAKKTFRRAIGL